jgi:NTP pyrophosphatase (non-canonical NTP hydrolase)
MEKFSEYQEQARKLDLYPIDGFGLLAHALGLANEAGEVLGKLKKIIRDENSQFHTYNSREDIKKELGDTLWYLSNLAYDFGLSLDEVATDNIKKLIDRKNRGVLKGSGDNR